jgi:hypothetical protein
MLFARKRPEMPRPGEALPGRPNPIRPPTGISSTAGR